MNYAPEARARTFPALKRILVVVDDDDIREVALTSLELVGGHEVSTVDCGRDGLARAREDQPDAILLDFMMPDLDGPATFERLQADPATRGIPVILLTAKLQAGRVTLGAPAAPAAGGTGAGVVWLICVIGTGAALGDISELPIAIVGVSTETLDPARPVAIREPISTALRWPTCVQQPNAVDDCSPHRHRANAFWRGREVGGGRSRRGD